MSWNNCTQAEAREAYDAAKSRYGRSAEEYVRNSRKLDACYADYSRTNAKADSMRSDKINFEKRAEQIGDIIQQLDDNGKVNDKIEEANEAAKSVESALSWSIKCSGVNCPPLGTIFKTPYVSENSYSMTALSMLKKEKARLEQALRDISAQLNALELEAQQLQSQMNSLAQTQQDLSRIMNACTYDMNHYKKFT